MVRIIEVGPRDGLQNESIAIPTQEKLRLITALRASGLTEIEATSFVSPKWVPQLGDAAELWPLLPAGQFSALIPNVRGLERALAAGVRRIAIFTAASEAFVERNMNMTIAESIAGFEEVVSSFRAAVPGGHVRAYISTVVQCPFSGAVSPAQVGEVTEKILALGPDEISFGETLGVAVPRQVSALFSVVDHLVTKSEVAWHFHDTWGTGIANIAVALEHGYENFDSSAGGLGGCPYAPGAGGNVSTEDLVYFLESNGIKTGVNLLALSQASRPTLALLGKPLRAKAQLAALAPCS